MQAIPTPSLEQIRATLAKLGYPFFERGQFNINTIGIRNAANDETGEPVPDKFNDLLVMAYKDSNNNWVVDAHPFTTIPGLHYFQQPINPQFGTGVLVPGFYQGVYALGQHHGLPALQQVGNFKVYRDRDRDGLLDLNEIQVCGPECGFNLHYYWGQANVHNASAGCQVAPYLSNSTKWAQLIWVYRKAIAAGFPNRFSYALIKEADLCA